MKALSIPEERVPILIGNGGETIEKIRELLQVEIEVNDNDITISSEDPLEELRAYNIIKAIGRGFKPEKALRLLERNSSLAVVNISDFAESEKSHKRLKGRVIGRKGMSKEKIENDTDTEIAVYGSTVSVLGPMKGVEVAKKTVEMLLNGSSHGNAYRFLENNLEKVLGGKI